MNDESSATLTLESYRLAKQAAHVACYVCQSDNSCHQEFCRHCHAPLALAHQIKAQGVMPQMIATIGAAGAGKTVYLGMLTDILSRQEGPLQILARGAFSINLQQTTMRALSQCAFPEKTPNEPDHWNWVHCHVRSKAHKRPLELVMPDMAGEAILYETEHPHAYPVIRALLSQCAGAIVLLDAASVSRGSQDQDFFVMKLLSYLAELDDHRRTGWPNRPIAVVLTKADECQECFADPAAFAQRRAPGVWRLCQQRFGRSQFFAAGVAGACGQKPDGYGGTQTIPLRIEPRGVVEPF
ncbi:MAG: GTPase domain-containing protein, partial [Planctomycetales bacterium]|nr:GTPase domain-containing protein [Planctomycetales bacterium]